MFCVDETRETRHIKHMEAKNNAAPFGYLLIVDIEMKGNPSFSDTQVELMPVTEKGKEYFSKKFGFGCVSVQISKNGALMLQEEARKHGITVLL